MAIIDIQTFQTIWEQIVEEATNNVLNNFQVAWKNQMMEQFQQDLESRIGYLIKGILLMLREVR